MAPLAPTAMHTRDELIDRAAAAPTVLDAFDAASARLQRLVDFDAAVWMAVDPDTMLPTAPTRAENMSAFGGRDACMRLWELEFFVEDDFNRYHELARAETPAAGLQLATDGEPARSTRFRELVRPKGFGDELRAVLRADGHAWASVTLLREAGLPGFGEDDTEVLADLSRPLAEAIRDHARPAAHPGAADRGPGLLVFGAAGELLSVNDDAVAWLDEITGDLSGEEPFGVRLPMLAVSTFMRARAEPGRTARARLRSASGRWLVCHASCLRDGDGDDTTALVIEPAKASEIAPIIAEAYELSQREREIAQLVARGLGTADIAAHLHLSTHTVRDHLKAVFDKVGVSSRGELVAKVFAEHYSPVHFADGGHQEIDA
jgi:DNA-binding CsgD family transcriptional regulator